LVSKIVWSFLTFFWACNHNAQFGTLYWFLLLFFMAVATDYQICLWILKTYSYATCDVTVTHDGSAVCYQGEVSRYLSAW